jgi:bifunctional non-homologous end joining protein LigD
MLASLEEPPVAQRGLLYEPKYDGIRALVDLAPPSKRGGPAHVVLYSRNGNDKTKQFPEIAVALDAVARSLDAPVLVDGEIVAIDRAGKPLGFQQIQGRIHLSGLSEIERAANDQPAALIVFDLLRDGDEDLRGLPLAARRLRLQERVRPSKTDARVLRLSEITADDGREMLSRARRDNWEGLIVKDGNSVYHSGRRTPAWRKLKLLKQQEFVVGGWTDPRLSRQHFGALLLGYYEGGMLHFAGSVGTGFNDTELDRLAKLLRKRAVSVKPFVGGVAVPGRPHWVKPELVVEVRFTEWTDEGLLRQPVYLGLREDKKAKDVRREEPNGKMRSAVEQRSPGEMRSPSEKTTPRGRKESAAEMRSPAMKSVASSRVRVAKSPASVAGVVETLAALEAAKRDGDVTLPNGDVLRVTNLAKVFWPELKITKGELMRYYVSVSPMLLPAIDDRPLVMKRFPNGVVKSAFYQQRHPESVPPGVRREVLPPDIEPIDEEGPRDRLIGGSLTTLVYMTQLASISQDPWFSRVADAIHQDYAAIDLDPGEGAGFDKVLDVARWVKEELDRLSIPAVPKTSGSRGLHIYIPLPKRTTYETGQLLCHMVASVVSTKHPKVATIERWVKKRPRATVYVDYLQNILGKTLATAYSARASDYAGVSTPLTWKEVEDGVDPHDFTVRTALDRFAKVGDLWEKLRTVKPVDLRAVLRKAK